MHGRSFARPPGILRAVSDDEQLVAFALGGDRDARRRLAARLIDPIHREVGLCLLRRAAVARRDPRQDVADLVQDVLVSLFDRDAQELRRWEPERGRSLASFVRLVARRRVARILGQRRGNPWFVPPVDLQNVDLDDQAAVAQRLEDRGQLDAVLAALHERMNPRDHELFDLLYAQELEPDEVAKRMQMTRGAVNAWSYRMRKLARSVADASSGRGDAPRGEAKHGG